MREESEMTKWKFFIPSHGLVPQVSCFLFFPWIFYGYSLSQSKQIYSNVNLVQKKRNAWIRSCGMHVQALLYLCLLLEVVLSTSPRVTANRLVQKYQIS